MWLLLLPLLQLPSAKAALLREAVRNTLAAMARQLVHMDADSLITLEQRIEFARALADVRVSLHLALQMEATGLARISRRHFPRPHRLSQASAAPDIDQLVARLAACIAMLEAGPAQARILAGKLGRIAQEAANAIAARPAVTPALAQSCAPAHAPRTRPPPRAGP